MWLRFLVAATGAGAPPGAAASQAGRSSITCRFELHDCALRPDVERYLRQGVEGILREYEDWLGLPLRTNLVLKIRIFGTEEDFRAFASVQGPKGPVSAFYSVERDDITTWQQRRADILVGVLFHEASHAILRRYLGRYPPLWLNEGLAEFMACAGMIRTPFGAALRDMRLTRCAELLRAGKFPAIEGLVSIRFSQFYRQDQMDRYAASWALVTFLKTSESRHRGLLRDLVLDQRERWLGSAGVVRYLGDRYPGGISRVEQELRGWILRAAVYRGI